MKTSNSSDELATWLSRPLCRQYVVVVPRTVHLSVQYAAGVRLRSVYWLFGRLSDAESEPLGAWLRADSSGLQPKLHGELKARGLERIRYLFVGDSGEDSSGLLSGYPGARLLGMNWQVAEGDEAQVPAVHGAARAAYDIHAALARSIRRHGSFANPSAALDFVAATLQRAERRMDRERAIAKVRPRLDSGAQTAASDA